MESENNSNGFNLEFILQKAPSEEIRSEMIVDAVKQGVTNDPKYIQLAIPILEKNENYAVLGSIYSNKQSPFYNSDKAIECYRTATERLSFKKQAMKKVGTGTVLKDMGKKTLKGLGYAYFCPTMLRKSEPDYVKYFEDSIYPVAGDFFFERIIPSVSAAIGMLGAHFIAAFSYGLSTNTPPSKGTFVFLAIPLVTNLASGLLEFYQGIRYRMQKELDEKRLCLEYEMKKRLEEKVVLELPLAKPASQITYDSEPQKIEENIQSYQIQKM